MPAAATSRRRFLKGLIVAGACARADEPAGLARLVAARATETRAVRDNYTYRQSVTVEEFGPHGTVAGQYKEIREVVFSPESGRTEQLVGKPFNSLQRLKLTPEDFQDMREVQPFLFDSDQLWAYETRAKGEENVDGVDCWVLSVRPRQILAGQRLFDGLLWAAETDYSLVRTAGKAVPEVRHFRGEENLFPRFTTLWEPVDGTYRFPVYTYADDTLDFRVGPIRIRLKIRYSNYRKFGAESSIQYK